MKILVILGHPKSGSFNHAIAEATVRKLEANGHTVFFHDLYQEKFPAELPAEEIPRDAILDPVVERHCAELVAADGVIIVHPNWWGMPPAILKGWIDRVIRPGVAYEFIEGDSGEGVPHGLLKAGTALVFNTSNTARERELKVFGDPLELLWNNCIFDLCGVKVFHRRMYETIVTSTLEDRQHWLYDVEDLVGRLFPGEE